MAGLASALRPHVESGEVPGLLALLARGDGVRVEALGVTGTSGRPMQRDSIFRAASLTKPLIAMLTMRLVEEGRLVLEAPVGDQLPELAEPRVLRTLTSELDDTVPCERPITARHLLTHTAGHGFPTRESKVVPLLMEQLHQGSMQVGEVPPPQEWMRRLAGIPLMHQPGDGWTYNAAYDVLGVLLPRASGQSLADVMAERLLEPLGMVDIGFHVPAVNRDRFTTLYRTRRTTAPSRSATSQMARSPSRPRSPPVPAASSPPSTTSSRSAGCCSRRVRVPAAASSTRAR